MNKRNMICLILFISFHAIAATSVGATLIAATLTVAALIVAT